MIFTEEDYRNSTQTSSPFICALEGILVPYVTFLILFKSGRMGAYRFYILNNVLTCFVLTVLCSVLNYTALFPSACFLLRPIVPITNMTAKYVVVLVMIGVVFMDMSEVWSLINRFAHAHPTIHDFLYRKHNTAYIVFMASTNIILALGLNLPFYFGSPDNEQDMIREVHRQLPNFNLTGRAVFCFYATQNSRYGLMFMIANLFGFLTFGIVCFIRLFWVIYGNKQSTLKIAKTLSLQVTKTINDCQRFLENVIQSICGSIDNSLCPTFTSFGCLSGCVCF